MNGNILTVNYPKHQHFALKRKNDPINAFKKTLEKKEPKTLAAISCYNVEEMSSLNDDEEKCKEEMPSEIAFVQLANAQSAIAFLKKEHEIMLKGLQDQLAELQQKCRDLQCCLTLKLPYIPKEVQQHISELENLVEEKEIECIEMRKDVLMRARKEDELRKELFFKEQAIIKLRKELAVRENIEEQLRKKIEAVQEQKTTSTKDVSRYERAKSLSSLFDLQKPTPPPKSTKDKNYSRPVSLYRRLLSLSSRSFNFENTPPILPPPCPPPPTMLAENNNSTTPENSSIPHLPQLVDLPNACSSSERPFIRQQIRINKLNPTDLKSQPVVLNHLALPKYRSPRMPSEENHNDY